VGDSRARSCCRKCQSWARLHSSRSDRIVDHDFEDTMRQCRGSRYRRIFLPGRQRLSLMKGGCIVSEMPVSRTHPLYRRRTRRGAVSKKKNLQYKPRPVTMLRCQELFSNRIEPTATPLEHKIAQPLVPPPASRHRPRRAYLRQVSLFRGQFTVDQPAERTPDGRLFQSLRVR
jgi:hypothetical protein